jgi:hypothetical protein
MCHYGAVTEGLLVTAGMEMYPDLMADTTAEGMLTWGRHIGIRRLAGQYTN